MQTQLLLSLVFENLAGVGQPSRARKWYQLYVWFERSSNLQVQNKRD
jgi:hypothetical protein